MLIYEAHRDKIIGQWAAYLMVCGAEHVTYPLTSPHLPIKKNLEMFILRIVLYQTLYQTPIAQGEKIVLSMNAVHRSPRVCTCT